MQSRALVITSIANDCNPALAHYAREAPRRGIRFIVIGDTRSPSGFSLPGCDHYLLTRQDRLPFALARQLPRSHYARKNLGYLIAIQAGSEVIIETDDDNMPKEAFWTERRRLQVAREVPPGAGWVNVYRYFTPQHVWPKGFALDRVRDVAPPLRGLCSVDCPIQQGLADQNPDVDAIYRLTASLPLSFESGDPVVLGPGAVCPFNSQNTTWFRAAFPLLYLPAYCNFRVTDNWRSFVAQRIAASLGWSVLFHQSTVWQERNSHDLMADFRDEWVAYQHNAEIVDRLASLTISADAQHLDQSLLACYELLVRMALVDAKELSLVQAWLDDLRTLAAA